MPNPSVARARKTPETRTAGMAIRAPTGTATKVASTRATSHGRPAAAKWPKVAAPTAANARWHSEICPDRRTSRPSDRNKMMSIRAADHTARWAVCTTGTIARRPITTTPARDPHPRRRVIGPAGRELGHQAASAPSSRGGSTISTTNRMRNGRLGGSPPIHDDGGRVLVDQRAGDADHQSADEGQRAGW